MAYTDEYPFEAYITNLGRYNEGALVGEWVKFPTTAEEIQDVFKRIGIDGVQYEEWFITDYDCHVEGINDALGEYESLDELNYLATKITELDKNEYEQFEAAIQMSDYSKSAKDLINLTDNLDKYDIYPDIHDHDDLGRMYIEEYGAMEVPEHLKNYIDYEAYGRDIALDEISQFTDKGYVRDTGDSFYEHYDGDRENIPEEYRVMSVSEAVELSENEKLEQAQEPFVPDDFMTGEKVETPRGSFSLTDMTKDQMESAGYGFHHSSDDGMYHIMGNGTRAFAITSEEYRPEPEAKISFYVAECIEFTDLGEYHNKLTLDEAIKLYEQIPADRMNAIKGIGFTLEDESPYDGDFPLLSGNTIDVNMISYIEHYRQSSLVQHAIQELIEKMPQATVVGEVENHLKNAEMAMEDDYGMIDGIINNGPKEVTPPGANEKPSIRERLTDAKRECAERKLPEAKKPDKGEPEHDL